MNIQTVTLKPVESPEKIWEARHENSGWTWRIRQVGDAFHVLEFDADRHWDDMGVFYAGKSLADACDAIHQFWVDHMETVDEEMGW